MDNRGQLPGASSLNGLCPVLVDTWTFLLFDPCKGFVVYDHSNCPLWVFYYMMALSYKLLAIHDYQILECIRHWKISWKLSFCVDTAGEVWRGMSEDDKKKYEKKSQEDQKRYEREMVEFRKVWFWCADYHVLQYLTIQANFWAFHYRGVNGFQTQNS